MTARNGSTPITTRQLVTLGMLTALLMAAQVAMAVLPNVETVSLLLVVYTLVYGRRVFLILYAFVFLEGILYGFGIWWFNYLYVWAVLVCLVLLLGHSRSPLLWAVVTGGYGLCFGALCAIPYWFVGGPAAAFAYWSAGIPFDLLHAGGNFVLTLVLFSPLYRLLYRLAAGQRAH